MPRVPSNPPSRLRRRQRRRSTDGHAATRVEILKSAAAAFRRHGYHGSTVTEIASALRMKKGNLYYYFRNKEEILFACHEYSLDRLLQLCGDIEQVGATADERLRQLIVAFVHTIVDELHGALLIDLEALTPAHRAAVIARRDRFDAAVRSVLVDGMRSGAFAAGDVKLLSLAILGAMNWIPRWFKQEGACSSEDVAWRFADYLLKGLRP